MPIDAQLTQQMIQWRHHLHRFPEIRFDVQQTADFIADKLTEWGIEVVRNVGKSGLVGILRTGDSPRAIGLRADMDALLIKEQNTFAHASQHEGKMHACGHDGHSTMLLGAAHYLAHHRDFEGTVYFIFQPDEEHGQGAQAMIDDGLFTRFPMDAVYGLHNLPGLAEGHFAIRKGPIMASESGFSIRITGQGGHAALPHMGVDTMVVGAQVITALQTLVSRNMNAVDEPTVVSVTEMITDGTTNVIPSQVTLKGDCRCFGDAALAKLETRMRTLATGICAAFDASCEVDFIHSFHSTINADEPTEHAIRAARQVLGDAQVEANCPLHTISEDFASMLRVQKGCYGLLGNGIDSVGGCALHNACYDFNDRILPLGAAYWVRLTLNHLSKTDKSVV